jgi:hypothetical protein
VGVTQFSTTDRSELIQRVEARLQEIQAERTRREGAATDANREYLGGFGSVPGQDITIGPGFAQAAQDDPDELLIADRIADYQTRASRGEINIAEGMTPDQLRQAAIGELVNEQRAGGANFAQGSTVPQQIGAFNIATNQYRPSDIAAVDAANQVKRQQIAEAGAEQIEQLPLGAFIGSTARAADFTGAGTALRNAARPELRGIEEELVRRNPVQGIAGQFAGAALPVAGAAGLSARVGGRIASALGAGAKARGAATAAAGFAGGELAQAPIAFQQTLNAGGSIEDAYQAAQNSALAYPLIAQKLVNGEEMTPEDALDIAFLIPEYFGIRGDFKAAIRTPEQIEKLAAAAAARVNADIRDGNGRAIAAALAEDMDTIRRYSESPEAMQALDAEARQMFQQDQANVVQAEPQQPSGLTTEPGVDTMRGLEEGFEELELQDIERGLVEDGTLLDPMRAQEMQTLADRQAMRAAGERIEEPPLLINDTGTDFQVDVTPTRESVRDEYRRQTGFEAPESTPPSPRGQRPAGEVPEPDTATAQPVDTTEPPLPERDTQDQSTDPVSLVQEAEAAIRAEGGRVNEKSVYDRVKSQGMTWRQVREARKQAKEQPAPEAPQTEAPRSEEPATVDTPPEPETITPEPETTGPQVEPPAQPEPEVSAPEPADAPLYQRDIDQFKAEVGDRGRVTVQTLRQGLKAMNLPTNGNRQMLVDRLADGWGKADKAKRDEVRTLIDSRSTRPPQRRGSHFEAEQVSEPNYGSQKVMDSDRPDKLRTQMKKVGNLDNPDAPTPNRMVQELAQKLNIGRPQLGRSRILKTRALGWYKPDGETIALQHERNLSTFIHEVGHHLHKLVFQDRRLQGPGGLAITSIPQKYHAEMLAVLDDVRPGARNSYHPNQYVIEGWGDFIRLLYRNERARVEKLAPEMLKHFESRMAQDFPAQKKALEKFANDYEAYVRSKPIQKATTVIARDQMPVKNSDFWRRIVTYLFDDHSPLIQFTKDVTKKAGIRDPEAELAIENNPIVLARRTTGRISGDLELAIKGYRFDPSNRRKRVGKGLSEILEPVYANLKEWESYMAMRRILEKRGQGYEGLAPDMSNRDIRAAIKDYERIYGPSFTQAAKEFQEFNQWMIGDYMVKHGMITPEAAKKIIDANLDYITFRPADVRKRGKGMSVGGDRYVNLGTGIKRFKKDSQGLLIEPPVSSYIAALEGMISSAQRNRVGQAMVTLAKNSDESGRWVRKVDPPMSVDTVRGESVKNEIKQRLANQGVDESEIAALIDPLEALLDKDDFRRYYPAGNVVDEKNGVFYIFNDGKKEYYQAVDPVLAEYVRGDYSQYQLTGAWAYFTLPGRIFRATVTSVNPDFFVVNSLRDLFSAMMYAKKGGGFGPRRIPSLLKQGYGKALYDFVMYDVAGKAEKHTVNDLMFQASGASQAGFFREYTKSNGELDINRMLGPRPPVVKAIKELDGAALKEALARSPLNVPGVLQRLNNRLEQANRMVEFQAQLRAGDQRGYTPDESLYLAGQAAADVTLDFQRGGNFIKKLNQIVPFTNAAMLGGMKLVRYIRNNPAEFVMRSTAYLGVPAAAEYWMNADNEEFWRIPLQQRDRYWHFPIGNLYGEETFVRIPKPYGLAVVPNTISRALAANHGINPVTGRRGDPKAVEGFGMLNMVLKDFMFPTTVPLFSPLMEVISNYSLFYGGEIVRPGEQFGPKEERGAERSSNLAAALGTALNVEPPKIDYMIQGLFGGFGQTTNEMIVDPLLGTVMRDRVRIKSVAQSDRTNIPIIRRFVSQAPKTYGEDTIRFYQTYRKAEEVNEGLTRRQRLGRSDIDDYVEKNLHQITTYRTLRPIKSRLDGIFKRIRQLENLEEPPDNLDATLDSLYDQARTLMRSGMTALEDAAQKKQGANDEEP